MEKNRSVIIVGTRTEDDALLRQQIADVSHVLVSETDPGLALELVHQLAPAIALLYLDHEPERILRTSSEIARRSAAVPMIVSRHRDPDRILLAMRSGAKEFAYLSEGGDDVRRAILELGAEAPAEPALAPKARMIAVVGARGGSGATTLATNLAAALLSDDPAENRGRVLLVDMDFRLGNALAFLDLEASFGWRDLADNFHRLDADLLHQELPLHPSGLAAVGTDEPSGSADAMDPSRLARILHMLEHNFEYIVADGLDPADEGSLLVLDAAETILLTLTQDVPSLLNARRRLDLFTRLGYGDDKVKLVLGRYRARERPDRVAIEDALRISVQHTVAEDHKAASAALNAGRLLIHAAPRSRAARDIRAVKESLFEDNTAKRRRFFGLLGAA